MKVACAGGGTLGSVTPLLAVIEELRLAGVTKVDWFGTADGPERELVIEANCAYHVLPAGKFRRYLSVRNITDILRIMVSFFKAFSWFKHNKVDALLTAGSFIAVPVGWAAWFAGVPVFIHQQDIRPGLANKLLSPVARRITLSLEKSEKDFPLNKAVVTGNPVRRVFYEPVSQSDARVHFKLSVDLPTIVVLGGGTGAKFLNDLVVSCLPELTNFSQIVHFTGKNRGSAFKASSRYLPFEFSTETPLAFMAADIVITRAGMGTITELATLKRAAIVVPIPGTHQEDNAQLLDSAGAAIVLSQTVLTTEVLLGTVRQLLNDIPTRIKLGNTLSKLLLPDAAQSVARIVRETIEH